MSARSLARSVLGQPADILAGWLPGCLVPRLPARADKTRNNSKYNNKTITHTTRQMHTQKLARRADPARGQRPPRRHRRDNAAALAHQFSPRVLYLLIIDPMRSSSFLHWCPWIRAYKLSRAVRRKHKQQEMPRPRLSLCRESMEVGESTYPKRGSGAEFS